MGDRKGMRKREEEAREFLGKLDPSLLRLNSEALMKELRDRGLQIIAEEKKKVA